jgi:hypothetical protein
MANQMNMTTRSPQMVSYPLDRAPRSLAGGMSAALFAPVSLFRSLALPMRRSRQWLWAAALMLLITGWATVRRAEWLAASASAPPAEQIAPEMMPMDMGAPQMEMGGSGQAFVSGGAGIAFDTLPPDGIPADPSAAPGAAADTSVSDTLMTALVAASGVIGAWLAQSFMLMIVPMLRGYAPQWGRALQVAIWASLPLGMMALARMAYIALGGDVLEGGVGVPLLLESWAGFATLPAFSQAALISLADHLTLFWLWSLLLLYLGARYALNGSAAASLLMVTLYALLAVIVPVLTGAVSAPGVSA